MNLQNEFIKNKELHSEYVKYLVYNGYAIDAYNYIEDNIDLKFFDFYEKLSNEEFLHLITYSEKLTINLLNSYNLMSVTVYEYIVDKYPHIIPTYIDTFIYELQYSNNKLFYLNKILHTLPNKKFDISILKKIDKDDSDVVYFINSNIDYPNGDYKYTIENIYTYLCYDKPLNIDEYQLSDEYFIRWFHFLEIDLTEFVIKYNLIHRIYANRFGIYFVYNEIALTLDGEDAIVKHLLYNKIDDKLIEIINKGISIGDFIKEASFNVCKNISYKELEPIVRKWDDLKSSFLQGILEKKLPKNKFGNKYIAMGYTFEEYLNIDTWDEFNYITSLLSE